MRVVRLLLTALAVVVVTACRPAAAVTPAPATRSPSPDSPSPATGPFGEMRPPRRSARQLRRFTDVTEAAMPDVLVRFSWELELLDVDGDWDLDAAISCKPVWNTARTAR